MNFILQIGERPSFLNSRFCCRELRSEKVFRHRELIVLLSELWSVSKSRQNAQRPAPRTANAWRAPRDSAKFMDGAAVRLAPRADGARAAVLRQMVGRELFQSGPWPRLSAVGVLSGGIARRRAGLASR